MLHYHQVPNVTDVGAMTDAVRWIQDRAWVDRLEATIEAHILRRRPGARGLHHPRDVLAHGLAVPRQAVDEGGAARSGRADRRVDRGRQRRAGPGLRRRGRLPADPQAPQRCRSARHHPGRRPATSSSRRWPPSAPRVSARSRSRSSSRATRASTTPCRSTVRARSTSSATTSPTCSRRCGPGGSRRSSSPPTASTRSATTSSCARWASASIEALGIGTSATHMEWFFGPKGLRFSEIGCRPPGVGRVGPLLRRQRPRPLPRVGERDRARHVVDQAVPAVRHRHRRAAPRARRHISGYSGIDEIQGRYGEWVIDAHLPDPGTPTQPPEAGYMANAYVRMRHPDYDALRQMLDDVGRTITCTPREPTDHAAGAPARPSICTCVRGPRPRDVGGHA